MSYFEILNGINVNDKTEERNGLTYLSWAWAWGELKKRYPMSFYTVYENSEGLMYHHDTRTAWVKTGVTVVDGEITLEHIEYLPVMDYRNKSISLDSITSFDVNKAIQRSLTKAIARHGLGLYIYAGEDLPEGEEPVKVSPVKPEPAKVSMTVSPDVLASRKVDLADISARYEIAPEALKAVTQGWGTKKLNEMTDQEYMEFTEKLKARFS